MAHPPNFVSKQMKTIKHTFFVHKNKASFFCRIIADYPGIGMAWNPGLPVTLMIEMPETFARIIPYNYFRGNYFLN